MLGFYGKGSCSVRGCNGGYNGLWEAVCLAAATFGLGLLLALFCPIKLVLVLAAAALIAVGVFLLL